MSGITAYLSFGKQNGLPAKRLLESLRLVRHRGMDDAAFMCLGFDEPVPQCYSCPDSSVASHKEYTALLPELKLRMGLGNAFFASSADDPLPLYMYDPSLHLGISMDGTIYNYAAMRLQLEASGYTFEGTSHAELILKAYKHWGEDCQNHFNGDWAFAIWDQGEQSLFCSRDRFGVKPLYYLIHGDHFILASEIKQLVPFLSDRSLNHSQILRMMKINAMLNYKDETIWKQIKSLQAGECLSIKNGRLSKRFYYQLDPLSFGKSALGFEEASKNYRELFLDSVKIRTKGVENLGISLSGGLDSSAIFCAVNNSLSTAAPAFSAYFEDDPLLDERKWIQLVLDRCAGTGQQLSPTPAQAWEALQTNTWFNDLPLGSGCPAQAAIMNLAAGKGIKTIVGGQGADELFAGYRHAQYRYLADLLRQGRLQQFTRETLNYSKSHSSLKNLASMGKTALSILLPESRLYQLELKAYRFDPFGREFHQAAGNTKPDQIQDLKQGRLVSFLYNMVYSSSLQTLLHFEDRMAAAHQLQSITPFLDYRLVEFAFSLPSHYKLSASGGKLIHRHAISPLIPSQIISRKDKSVFGTPITRFWMRNELKGEINDLLHSPQFRSRQIWNLPLIMRHWQKYLNGSNSQAEMLYNIVAMELWFRAFAPYDELL